MPASSALSNFEDRFFTERHIRIFGIVLLAANLGLFGLALLSGESAIAPHGGPNSIDFAQFYAAGAFASAHPASVYSHQAGIQWALSQPAGALQYSPIFYPPWFLIFLTPLSQMPFFVAFGVWLALTVLLYLAAVYAIVPRSSALIAAVAPAVVVINAQLGQNGFLTAGLMGLALASLPRRPLLAGALLGLLAYKPQFGLLLPLALIADRQWRAIAGAAATILAVAAVTTVFFGPGVWAAYIAALPVLNPALTPPGMWITFQSVFGALRWLGVASVPALALHLVFAGVIGAIVCTVWRVPARFPLKAAALCAGAVAATPFVLAYDLCVLTMAVGFLVQDGLCRGFRAGERLVFLLCFVLSAFLARPLGFVICAVILGLVVRRVLADRREFWPAEAGVPSVHGAHG